MADNLTPLDSLRKSILAGVNANQPPRTPRSETSEAAEVEEDCCPAFGFLRGTRERGVAIEFRFRNGNRLWFPYSCLGAIQFNPSAGLLLRFTGDALHLVLVRGSNLDAPIHGGTMNLTDRGLQRFRITYLREMDEDELRRTPKNEPAIDQIEAAEFDSRDEATIWLRERARNFAGEV